MQLLLSLLIVNLHRLLFASVSVYQFSCFRSRRSGGNAYITLILFCIVIWMIVNSWRMNSSKLLHLLNIELILIFFLNTFHSLLVSSLKYTPLHCNRPLELIPVILRGFSWWSTLQFILLDYLLPLPDVHNRFLFNIKIAIPYRWCLSLEAIVETLAQSWLIPTSTRPFSDLNPKLVMSHVVWVQDLALFTLSPKVFLNDHMIYQALRCWPTSTL